MPYLAIATTAVTFPFSFEGGGVFNFIVIGIFASTSNFTSYGSFIWTGRSNIYYMTGKSKTRLFDFWQEQKKRTKFWFKNLLGQISVMAIN
jgi:hypothetical protein